MPATRISALRPRSSPLLLVALLALAGGPDELARAAEAAVPGPGGPPASSQLALGPHATCVSGPAPACAGESTFQVPTDLAILSSMSDLTFGLRHGCALGAGGRALCWGDASEGQLGIDPARVEGVDHGRPSRVAPTPVDGAADLVAIDAGWLHTCGIDKRGAVLCWGADALDQLGRVSAGPGISAVTGLGEPVTGIAAGGVHTCVVRRDGGVSCWGDGSMGQLGQGEKVDASSPAAGVALPGRAVEIAAGAYHSCARIETGAVVCWGDNRFGQLGDGSRTASATPVPVRGLAAPARAVAAGFSFTCALLEDGRAQCWGSNELGELGSGRPEERPAKGTPPAPPAFVVGLPGPAGLLVAAGNHACARDGQGRISCWGSNESGQLGDGSVVARDRPVAWRGAQGDRPRPTISLDRPSDRALPGLDVSYHSGRVDWAAAVAGGNRFGLTLATAGVDFCDPFFFAHWEGMRQAGLLRGAYHFFVAEDDPEQQARHFLAHVTFEPGDLAPVVDIESRKRPVADLSARLKRFLAIVEEAVGTKPIIYTGPSFWRSNMTDAFGEYPLWIAEYGVDSPSVPEGWTRWHLWQWRGDVELPGSHRSVPSGRRRSAPPA